MRKFEYVSRMTIIGHEIIEPKFELPKRSTKNSAGYDFFVPEDTVCKSHEITMVKTGVKAYFPDNETLLLFNRSSNPKKKGLIILNRCSELWIVIIVIMKITKVRLLDYFIICLMKMLF